MTWGTLSAHMSGRRVPFLRSALSAAVVLLVALAALLTPGATSSGAGSALGAATPGGLSAPMAARALRSAARPGDHASGVVGAPASTVAAQTGAGDAGPVAVVGVLAGTTMVRATTAVPGPLLVGAVTVDHDPTPAPRGVRVDDRRASMPRASVIGADGARAPPGRI